VTFDEDAERYDRARPAYPPAMFEHLADLAGADAASSPVQAIAALTVREEQILATVARAASALLHIGRKCERAAGPSAGTDRAALPMCSCGVVTMLTSWTT